MTDHLKTLADDLAAAGHTIPASHVYRATVELMQGAATGDMEAAVEAAHVALTAAYDTANKIWQSEIWDASDALRRHQHTTVARYAADEVVDIIRDRVGSHESAPVAAALRDHLEAALQALEAADNADEAAAYALQASYLQDALTALLNDLDLFDHSEPLDIDWQNKIFEAIEAASNAMMAARCNE